MPYTDLIEYNVVGDERAPLLRCFPFEAKSWDYVTTNNHWIVYELSDI